MFQMLYSSRCFALVAPLLFLIASSTTCLAQPNAEAPAVNATWVDMTGKFRIEAVFVRMDQKNVILRKSDGKEVSVPLNKLNVASRKMAVAAAKSASSTAMGDSDSRTESSSTSLNAQLPSSSKTPVINIPSGMGAKQFVDFVMQNAKDGKAIILWDVLLPKYQQDIERVAKLAGEKTDPDLMKPILQTHSDIVKILRSKKQFVLNNPQIKELLQNEQIANTYYDPMVDLIDAYMPKALLNPTRLKSGNLRPLIDAYLTEIQQKAKAFESKIPQDSHVKALAQSAKWENFSYAVEDETSDTATLVLKRESSVEQQIALKNIDGRWLPKILVDNWDNRIEQIIKELEGTTPEKMAKTKKEIQKSVMMVGGMLKTFAQANDQESFNNAATDLIAMASMAAGMPNLGQAPGQGPPPGFPFPQQ